MTVIESWRVVASRGEFLKSLFESKRFGLVIVGCPSNTVNTVDGSEIRRENHLGWC